jgi:hypothetical protein
MKLKAADIKKLSPFEKLDTNGETRLVINCCIFIHLSMIHLTMLPIVTTA